MKKVLRFEEVFRTDTSVDFRVAEQSHRGEKFGCRGDESREFLASNGFVFCSDVCPDFISGDVVWVRGSKSALDNKVCSCTVGQWEMIQEAAREYNDFEFDNIEEAPKKTEVRPVEADARLKIVSFIMAALPVSEFSGYDEMAIEALKRADAVMNRLEEKQ